MEKNILHLKECVASFIFPAPRGLGGNEAI